MQFLDWHRGAEPLPDAKQGFGYVFQRFPSFTQTFCYREIEALRSLGMEFPVVAINRVEDEPEQDFPKSLQGITHYLPVDVVREARDRPVAFRFTAGREGRRALRKFRKGPQHRRLYEALWLGPLLQKAGARHAHSHFAGVGARVCLWMKRIHGIDYSFTAHANDFFTESEDSPVSLEALVGGARFLVSVSDFGKRHLCEKFPGIEGKVRRVYNGMPLPAAPAGGRVLGKKKIVSVGRYIEKKGYPDLLRACGMLRDLDFECHIVGEGPLAEALNHQIHAQNLQGRVFLTGPRKQAEVWEILCGADLFVLPCVKDSQGGMDNLPTVIVEAMAARLPVVSTRLAGVPEMVEEGGTGFLVEPRDVDGLAGAMRKLLVDGDLSAQMGHQGRAKAEQQFSIDATSRELVSVFREFGALSGFDDSHSA